MSMDVDTQYVLYEVFDLLKLLTSRLDNKQDSVEIEEVECMKLLHNIRKMLDQQGFD